jgi:hypothetical protein
MELVSDMGRVESCFSPFGDSVSVSARLEHGLHRTYHRHRNRFGRSRSDSYVTRIKWKLDSVCFGIVLLLMQDWFLVCTKCSIGIEIVLNALGGTLGDEAQVEPRFGTFGDSATVDARLVLGLRRMCRRLRNSIGGTRWNS